MKTITTNDLRDMSSRGDDFRLINVLPASDFAATRIPGAQNIPLETLNFATQVEQLVGEKDRTVVVYCASQQCPASTKAAEQLQAAGFTNVLDYKGGAQAWQESQQPATAVL